MPEAPRLIVAPEPPRLLRSELLKKPGTLTSSKVWVALTNETLTWFSSQPPSGADLATTDVADHKHRMCLAELAIWESVDHETDFEVEVEGLKPLTLREPVSHDSQTVHPPAARFIGLLALHKPPAATFAVL